MKGAAVGLGVLSILGLVLPFESDAQSRQVLQPTEHCRDHPATAVVTFADPDLEAVVRAGLSVGAQDDLTCGLVSQLTRLSTASDSERVVYGGTLRPSPAQPFESLDGIQNLRTVTRITLPRAKRRSPRKRAASACSWQLYSRVDDWRGGGRRWG